MRRKATRHQESLVQLAVLVEPDVKVVKLA